MSRARALLVGAGVISAAYASLLLFRFTLTGVTPASSFGRVWQYYVSWADFGFHRRGLVGTLLDVTRMNQLGVTEYQFAYGFYALLLALLLALMLRLFCVRPALRAQPLLAPLVLLSPATLAHLAYGSGNLDAVLCILLVLALFYARPAWLFAALLVAGVLTHEMFVLLLPAAFLLRTISKPQLHQKIRALALPALAVALSIAVVMLYGKITPTEAEYLAVMVPRIPLAAAQESPALGYFEVGSGVSQNIGPGLSRIWNARSYAALPTLYALLLAWLLAYHAQLPRAHRVLLCAALLTPLAATLIAWDYYRWISFSAWLSLLAILALTLENKLVLPRRVAWLLLAFTLLSPIGPDVLVRPFPIHQTLLEKLAR